jgi:hypothetical protein
MIITENDLIGNGYWNNRWEYIGEVVDIVKSNNYKDILEIGANCLPVVSDCHTMEINPNNNPTYFHDATQPFPIEDKKYDLVIALQVWEHLYQNSKEDSPRQKEAFEEVMRVSKEAILSFPYLWDCPNDFMHHNVTKELIKEWTCGVKPIKEIIVGDTYKRIICHYKF